MKENAAHSENAVQNWPAQLTVQSSEAALVLTSLREAIFLKYFFQPEGRTIGEAAQHFGLTPNASYRRVKRLERLDILQEVRQETRRGKPVRYYRTRARTFFILDHLYPVAEWVRVGLQEQMEVFNDNLVRAVQDGPNPVSGLVAGELDSPLRVAFADSNGTMWNPRGPGTAVTKWAFKTLHLDYARAQQMMSELRAVVRSYSSDTGADLYLIGQFITPVTGTSDRDQDSALRLD